MSPTKATRLIVDRAGRPRRRIRGYRLVASGVGGFSADVRVDAPTFRVGSRPSNDLVIPDDSVSRAHFEIRIDEHGYRLRDLESRNGTLVDGRRSNDVYLDGPATIRIGESELRFSLTENESDIPASESDRFGPMVGGGVAMREVFALLERAADSPVTILVEGETGTGKELVAQAIHEASPRRAGPFVVLDCAAVEPTLLSSELFGHEKGAFTGATGRSIGRLEEANGGTLFIDELGELPIDLQPKLLRALETRTIRRLGGKKEIELDLRVVAATNRDLLTEINRGSFREDLFYRLAVVHARLPPLRERREDIRLLVCHLVGRALPSDPGRAEKILSSISDANWERLEEHPWPGNVRQLRNVIHRTLALSRGDVVEMTPPASGRRAAPSRVPSSGPASPELDLTRPYVEHKAEWLAHFERSYLGAQLERHGGNISRAAAASGMDRMYFKRVLKKHRG